MAAELGTSMKGSKGENNHRLIIKYEIQFQICIVFTCNKNVDI
jgi:hypothetical protein